MKMRDRAGRGAERLSGMRWWPSLKGTRTAMDLMRQPAVVVPPDRPAADAESWAVELGIHHLVVLGPKGDAAGVLCLCDLWGVPAGDTVSACMSSPAETVDSATPLEEVAALMRREKVGCLPVIAEGRVVGLVTRGDLRRAGVLSEQDCPRCVVCRSYHHVRTDSANGKPLCLQCHAAGGLWATTEWDEEVTEGD